MPFQLGHKRFGGRPKGTPANLRLCATVQEKLEALGFDPIEKMHQIIQDPETPIEVAAKLTSDLSKFVYAQRKSVEHSGANGAALAVAQVKIEFVSHNDQSEVSVSTPVPLPSGTL